MIPESNPIIEEIKKTKLIFVEGKDDQKFFVKFCDHLDIKNFYIQAVDSKTLFKEAIPRKTKILGFDKVTHLAIIRDKDSGSIEDAFNSIKNIFTEETNITNLPQQHGQWSNSSPKIGIFIIPGNQDGSMLEDLCLNAVTNQSVMSCVEEFTECLKDKPGTSTKIAKTKTLAYLAAQKEPANSIGLGALKGYWDFDAPELNELKEFLLELK